MKQRVHDSHFLLHPNVSVLLCASPAGQAAANILRRYLVERCMAEPRLVGPTEIQDTPTPAVIMGTPEEVFEMGFASPISASSLADEEYVVASSGQMEKKRVYILGGSARAVIYGMGKWLRSISYDSDGVASVPFLLIRESPLHEFRSTLLSTHYQDRGYSQWTAARHKEYLEDLALWGANVGMVLPMQFGQRSAKVWERGTLEAAEWEPIRQFPIVARELGLRTAAYLGANDVFPEDYPSLKPAEGGDGGGIFVLMEQCHVCPSDAPARQVILRRREELFSALPYLDYLYVSSSDYGGCACAQCRPYLTNAYLPLVREIDGLLKKYHPGGKIVVGTQCCTREHILGPFSTYMHEVGKEWVDYVCYAVHGTATSLLETLEVLPADSRRILLYPEITMLDNWGGIGAMPMVERFAYSIRQRFDIGQMCIEKGGWDSAFTTHWLNEDDPIAFDPATMYGGVRGTFSYSEGLHDDINKVTWLSYGFNPHKKPEDVRLEYAKFYFGEDAASDAVVAMRLMEKHSVLRCLVTGFCPPLTAAGKLGEEMAEEVTESVRKAASRLPHWAKGSWRFQMLQYRASMDRVAFRYARGDDCKAEIESMLGIARQIHGCGHHLLQKSKPFDDGAAYLELTSYLQRFRETNAPG